jgi:hypothetical protein
MRIRLLKLTLLCNKSTEVIQFSPNITFFHGQTFVGKSSIARLIDYCLGASNFERGPAISEEVNTIQLLTEISDHVVLFERGVKSPKVKVTWQENDVSESINAPVAAGSTPIFKNNIYNLSDLIFYLFGITPLTVPRSGPKKGAMVRLSFHDMMSFCYLQQKKLLISFFDLGEDANLFDRYKSRFMMRFILGLYDEKLNDIEARLIRINDRQKHNLVEIESLKTLLTKFGYDSEERMQAEIKNYESTLQKLENELKGITNGYAKDTNFVDDLRSEIINIGKRMQAQKSTLAQLNEKISIDETLKAEFISNKFKLARSFVARKVLDNASFELCPSCGSTLKEHSDSQCVLCGNDLDTGKHQSTDMLSQSDLDDKIDELSESIERHRNSLGLQVINLKRIQEQKIEKEVELEGALKVYESRFLSQSRQLERQIATLEERNRTLKHLSEMPRTLTFLLEENKGLKQEEQQLNEAKRKELESRECAERLIQKTENEYLSALLEIPVPGVLKTDKVRIDRKTWIPEILPMGEESGKWNFFTIGSAGVKTLLNVCFAITIHKIAAENNLPLPTLLMIDSPVANIDKDVDKKIVETFYQYLYRLSQNELSGTQLILIDNRYCAPIEQINIIERFMTRDDPEFPPLISYYRPKGPALS